MSRTHPDAAVQLLRRVGRYDEQRFLAVFDNDRRRAAQALWSSFETVPAAGVLDREDALTLLAEVHDAEIAQVVALFRKLASEDSHITQVPGYGQKSRPYAGWSLGLEQLLRAVEVRPPLIHIWSTLADPVGPALGFALARLGHLPGAALGEDLLLRFARYAAERYTWCAEGFEGAERAFGEERWRRAVVEAAASAEVTAVGMWASHFAPFAPYATDEQLLTIAPNLTWGEPEIAELFWGRGLAMQALLERRADELREGPPISFFGKEQFLLGIYASELLHRGAPLPERFDGFVDQLLGQGTRAAAIFRLLRAMPPERREPILLRWAERLDLRQGENYDELTEFATPALARWAVNKITSGTESFWLEMHFAQFGPGVVDALAELPDLNALPTWSLWAALPALDDHPSPTAARLAGQLLGRPDVGPHAATVLSRQALPDLIAEARAALLANPQLTTAADALARRFFDPEVRTLAAELAPQLPRAIRQRLQLVLQPLPGQIEAFVRRAREGDALATMLYATALRPDSAILRELTAEAVASDEQALWFYLCCVWEGGARELAVVAEAAEGRIVGPLLALWQRRALLERITREGASEMLLWVLHKYDLATLLDLLPAAARSAREERRAVLRAGLETALARPDLRERAVMLLRELLHDTASWRVALEILAAQFIRELAGALDGMASSKRVEQRLMERARSLAHVAAQQPARLTDLVLDELPCRRADFAFSAAVGKLALAGTTIGAATLSELAFLERDDGHLRASIPDLGSGDHWLLAPDGSWLAVVDDGVTLWTDQGRKVSYSEDDDEEELDHLYPNDGIAGALPLSADRLLVWAIGHNVYDPLTLYEIPGCRELDSPAIQGFGVDAVLLPDGAHFVVLRMGGAVELRRIRDGRALQQLGGVRLKEADWPQLAAAAGGDVLLVLADSGIMPLVRQPDDSYARLAPVPDGRVVAQVDAHSFAVLHAEAADIYGSDGALRGRLVLPQAERPLAALAQGSTLLIAADDVLWRFDLERLAPDARRSFPSAITALAGDSAGWVAGTADGAIFRSA